MNPTLGGFQDFITNIMAVPSYALDLSSPVIVWSYDYALNIVNLALENVPSQSTGYSIYTQAVYNLAADTLINWAQDPAGVPKNYQDKGGDPIGFWSYLRNSYGVNNFVAGVVRSSSDEGTSVSYEVPEAFKQLTISNLNNLKTPYGRTYLGIAQSWGSVWGLT